MLILIKAIISLATRQGGWGWERCCLGEGEGRKDGERDWMRRGKACPGVERVLRGV
jgi:hypothetical protein